MNSGLSDSDSTPTDSFGTVSDSNTATSAPLTDSDSNSGTANESAGELNDGGCICSSNSRYSGGLLALLFVLSTRRRRP
jgi:hypothetical protein